MIRKEIVEEIRLKRDIFVRRSSMRFPRQRCQCGDGRNSWNVVVVDRTGENRRGDFSIRRAR